MFSLAFSFAFNFYGHLFQNNKDKFTEYLKAFTKCYSGFISADFNHLDSQGLVFISTMINFIKISIELLFLVEIKEKLLIVSK